MWNAVHMVAREDLRDWWTSEGRAVMRAHVDARPSGQVLEEAPEPQVPLILGPTNLDNLLDYLHGAGDGNRTRV